MTYETGATTHAANNLVLSVLNDGEVYQDRLHIGFAMLQGSSHRGLTFRELASNEATKQRKQGCKFKPQEITEAAKLIQADTIRSCLEMIRDEWTGEKVAVQIHRWFDKINGNSYFSCLLTIPRTNGFRQVIVPFQYGYGSQPQWEAITLCEKIGLFEKGNKAPSELPVVFSDRGYMRKRDLFHSDFYL